MSHAVPLDPMYARFRERHPEVTLVLLAAPQADGDVATAPLGPGDAVEVADPEESDHALAQTRDDVGALLVDVCAALDVEARIEVHWRSGSRNGAVRAVATTHAPLSLTAQETRLQLAGLGWRVRFTSRAPVPCLDARIGDHALRAVIHQGRVLLTLTGPDVVVGPRRSVRLVNRQEETARG